MYKTQEPLKKGDTLNETHWIRKKKNYFSENITFLFTKYANAVTTSMTIWTQRNTLVCLTGVWVLPTGVGALSGGGCAVCWGGGGGWKLAAGVWSVTQLVSSDPSGGGSGTVGMVGGWRRMLWRALLVQRYSFTNYNSNTDVNNRLFLEFFQVFLEHIDTPPVIPKESEGQTDIFLGASLSHSWAAPLRILRTSRRDWESPHLMWSPLGWDGAAGLGCCEIGAFSPSLHLLFQVWCSSAYLKF